MGLTQQLKIACEILRTTINYQLGLACYGLVLLESPNSKAQVDQCSSVTFAEADFTKKDWFQRLEEALIRIRSFEKDDILMELFVGMGVSNVKIFVL